MLPTVDALLQACPGLRMPALAQTTRHAPWAPGSRRAPPAPRPRPASASTRSRHEAGSHAAHSPHLTHIPPRASIMSDQLLQQVLPRSPHPQRLARRAHRRRDPAPPLRGPAPRPDRGQRATVVLGRRHRRSRAERFAALKFSPRTSARPGLRRRPGAKSVLSLRGAGHGDQLEPERAADPGRAFGAGQEDLEVWSCRTPSSILCLLVLFFLGAEF